MAKRRVPPEVTEFFRKIGKKHGASGGHAAAANMTAEQRSEKARRMVRARKTNPVRPDAVIEAEREAKKIDGRLSKLTPKEREQRYQARLEKRREDRKALGKKRGRPKKTAA